MNVEEPKTLLRSLCAEGENACKVARKAKRQRASLAGSNFYGNKFHSVTVKLSTVERSLLPSLAVIEEEKAKNIKACLATIKSTDTSVVDKDTSLRELRHLCESDVIPSLDALTANPVPKTEQVLPLSVLAKTRTYLETIATQANGCYEHQWFDACSVMIRKLVETLIIELYEEKSKADRIKDDGGNYLLLRDLIDRVLNDSSWNLGRETKKGLPLVKSLGDNSAHNRRFIAKKEDVDKFIGPLRVLTDELLHLSGLK